MSWTEKRARKCREFGVVMALALVIIGGVLLWRERFGVSLALLGAAGVFLLPGLFFPRVLDRPQRLWMALAEKMSIVVTYIVVTLTFYFVITPIALLLRIIGKDVLQLKLEPERESYWDPVEEDGPSTRHFLPY